MRRALVILLGLTTAAPALWAGPIFVSITSPRSYQPSFGELEFSALVTASEEIDRVEFYVDGQMVGRVTGPEYWVTVDVGGDNVERQFTVIAYDVTGAQGTATITTPKLTIDLEVDVDLQQLYVTVTRAGTRVLNLRREDFTVVDDGVEQELVTFERGDVPITAALALDASESMVGERLVAAINGARAFLAGLNPLDEAMTLLFSDRVQVATPFTNRQAALVSGLEGATASGGTALNDHLYAALNLLHRQQGRRTLVLLSDGVDVVSALDVDDVLWKVRRSDALIYWIRLQTESQPSTSFSSSWRGARENLRQAQGLEEVVRQSGGRIEVLSRIEELTPAFEGIMRELREQYVLGYYPSNKRGNGRWHPIKVRVDAPLVTVRTREGYVDVANR